MSNLNKVYLISGLGADESFFEKLNFGDCTTIFIEQVDPLLKDESLESYCKRLSQNIEHKSVIVGLSFGGILAIEIAKLIPVQKIILISSVKNRIEIPTIFKIIRKLQLHKIFPYSLLIHFSQITFWMFGTKNDKHKQILKKTLVKSKQHYIKWAVNQIVNWQNVTNSTQIIHLHGNKDKIFPIKFIKECIKINNGTHNMILDESEQINIILTNYL